MMAQMQRVSAVLATMIAVCIAGAADAGTVCYEAEVAHYPWCGDYESSGYSCVNGWCAVGACVGDCNKCAVMREGRVVSQRTGRCVEPVAEQVASAAMQYAGRLTDTLRTAASNVNADTASELSKEVTSTPLKSLLAVALLLIVLRFSFSVMSLVASLFRSVLTFGTGLFVGFLCFTLVDQHMPVISLAVKHVSHTVFGTSLGTSETY
eukprot:TRINITY_DN28686_c0_g1_i1.p1 TRINITY_DN28686_c0_g1~~TRINITY_DN28686_c0_g1_i1.p1  ORF type:complete len:208 (+),score=70.57 TRINITY_DN28686_c0_g1_i1:43-666(+)